MNEGVGRERGRRKVLNEAGKGRGGGERGGQPGTEGARAPGGCGNFALPRSYARARAPRSMESQKHQRET